MTPVSPEDMAKLEPFIAGALPDHRGEVYVFCPLHKDTKPSASINVVKGLWFCHAGCGGGSIRHLVLNEDAWVDTPTTRVSSGAPFRPPVPGNEPTMTEVLHWHKRLRREESVREKLYREKGIVYETIRKAMLGWDGKNIKIPVFSPTRQLWNVRTYDLYQTGGGSKIWNTRGMGKARLYPISVLQRAELGDSILLCEGEFDTLLALQEGALAVTHTDGAGKRWKDIWTDWFVGLDVYLCHDCDVAGAVSDSAAGVALQDVAVVWECHLPYEYKEKHGHDLSDLLLSKKNRKVALRKLMSEATEWSLHAGE
jgi:hypothetical protein